MMTEIETEIESAIEKETLEEENLMTEIENEIVTMIDTKIKKGIATVTITQMNAIITDASETEKKLY